MPAALRRGLTPTTAGNTHFVTNLPPPDLSDSAEREASQSDGGRPEALFGVSFGDRFRAEEYLLALRGMAAKGDLVLGDAVVVFKDDDGRVRVNETTDMQPAGAAVKGALWAGLLGLLIAGPLGWLAGLGLGAGAGAITAKVVDIGIPDEWVEWFKNAVQPHTATVVALASEVDLDALYREARRFAGAELVHTTLRPGASADLAAALNDRPGHAW
jgi:uncharacterized membrane protein